MEFSKIWCYSVAMKYAIYIFVFFAVLIGGYFMLAPQTAQNFNVMEEEAQTKCKIKIVMYSTPHCKYCTLAKQVFQEQRLPVTEVDISIDQKRGMAMVKKTGKSSVPQIFINGHHIGGYGELLNLKATGKLKQFLRTCDTADLE